ncbi:MAG: pyrimidine reductase family protein [Mycobacteriaceae bacterium]
MQKAEAVRFTLLGGHDAVDDDRLRDLYTYPATDSGAVVRGNAIVSLDGGATTAGTSGGLGGPGDRRLFATLRELADVIVVGAGTARAENYAGARMTAAQRRRRQECGQSEVPPIALVTRSGVLDRDLPVLADTEVPPLLLTCANSAAGVRARLGSAAEVLDCSGPDPDRVDLSRALRLLTDRGLRRVLTEGGPSLLGALIAEGLIDELCLTTAPIMVGGAALRIATGADDVLARMRRAHVLTDEDGYLYSRYIVDHVSPQ